MQDCGCGKRSPAKCHFQMLVATINFTESKMCVSVKKFDHNLSNQVELPKTGISAF
jgi:hypothetical protein